MNKDLTMTASAANWGLCQFQWSELQHDLREIVLTTVEKRVVGIGRLKWEGFACPT
jgi:hypothetical protein